MNNPFIIDFDLTLEYTSITVPLQAIAEQVAFHEYRIHSFRHLSASSESAHLLPDQQIKCFDRDGHKSWVDLASEKETLLSIAIGKAIDKRSSDA